jgi:hypothetical protein
MNMFCNEMNYSKGNGKEHFSGLTRIIHLQLVETRAFSTGVVLLRYRPKPEEKT